MNLGPTGRVLAAVIDTSPPTLEVHGRTRDEVLSIVPYALRSTAAGLVAIFARVPGAEARRLVQIAQATVDAIDAWADEAEVTVTEATARRKAGTS